MLIYIINSIGCNSEFCKFWLG